MAVDAIIQAQRIEEGLLSMKDSEQGISELIFFLMIDDNNLFNSPSERDS